MEKEQFKELTDKLNIITRLLALNLVKDMKTQNEKITTLSSFSFGPSDIAEMLGTSSNTVSVALSKIRSKKKKQPPEIVINKENGKQETQTTEGQQTNIEEEKSNA